MVSSPSSAAAAEGNESAMRRWSVARCHGQGERIREGGMKEQQSRYRKRQTNQARHIAFYRSSTRFQGCRRCCRRPVAGDLHTTCRRLARTAADDR